MSSDHNIMEQNLVIKLTILSIPELGSILLHHLLLAKVSSPLGAELGEDIILGLAHILVEPPLALLTKMLHPQSSGVST